MGSIPEYLQGNLDAVLGEVEVDLGGELVTGGASEGETLERDGGWELSGAVLVGEGASVGEGARIDGPAVLATRCDGRRRGDRQAVGAAGRRRGPVRRPRRGRCDRGRRGSPGGVREHAP